MAMDIRSRDEAEAKARRSALYLHPQLANVVRKLARLEDKTLDELVDLLVREFVRERPQYELTEASNDEGYRRAPKRESAASAERRKGERRNKKGTAALWESQGNIDRRTKGSDRRKP